MKLKKFMFMVIMAALAVVLAACGGDKENSTETGNKGAGESRTFKISHVVQESHVWNATAVKFGEELEKLSNGRMKVQIFPASQLGTEADMVQQMETGAVEFAFLTNAYMSTREDSLNSWFMPYLFNNLDEAVAMRESEEAKEMLASLSSQGLLGLDFMFAGNRHVLMKDGFAETPEDLKGKKIRIIGSPAMQSYWEKVGAGPTAMPLPEVYTSLQTGVIDGIDIDLDALVTEKYYENAKYLTLTNQMTFPTVIVMSQSVYDQLPTEDQEIVKQAMKTAVDWGVQEAVAREKANLETLKSAGVEVLEEIDTTPFQAVSNEVKKEFSDKSEIVKSFIETVESK
ncbi:TRAP transporter substrate-binding protein [Lysinibacillus macroides]|uniref:C4-dicarboxylate ABC transporter substrate-binding protein n=1 Tax=Lysinibacillus macroides TaxID=33935 RepID=A0A0M9DKK4_9BACI|nr:TRAP transporter substrate-binding protein [Lysinibacillus macroides]KOY82310.1 C4-dicarboxylate ABC transporter substrate-binding protein [Lysinibacillus macroides]QPR68105.1 TRAP transporter substrate-binding protein [Lysinibacillus macroides]